jgi:hypothetical protein
MKAISIIQPWASLIGLGEKRIETRSWSTHYRGPIAIHASKAIPREVLELVHSTPHLRRALIHCGVHALADLPRGGIVATATLVDCVRIDNHFDFTGYPEYERSLGFYAEGRFGWIMENIAALPDLVPAKGNLGIWEWEDAA